MAGVEGEQLGEVDAGDAVGVGRAETLLPPSRSSSSLMRPPVGVSRPVSTHSTATPRGHGVSAGETLDQLALVAGGKQKPL